MSQLSAEGLFGQDAHRTDARGQPRRDRMVWRAYAFAARHLLGLTVPSLLVFPPLGLIAVSTLLVVADGSAAVVNGDFQLIGSLGVPVLVWAAVVMVATVAGQMVVLPATVILAAGRLVGENVSVSGAMRVAARRWPAMLALLLIGAVVIAADAAAGFGLLMWNGAQVTAFAVTALLVLFSLPCLLAVPGVVLTKRSARRSLALAYRLTSQAAWATAFTLAFGVVIFPALAQQALNAATSAIPIARIGAGCVLALVATPFQATVIARLFLRRLLIAGKNTELRKIVDGLPQSASHPARPAPVLAALLLPALLYGGAVLVNPLGWLEVSQTAVTKNLPPDSGMETSQADGRPRPRLDWSDKLTLRTGPGGRMVMLLDGSRQAKLLTCLDSGCAQPRLTWAEPAAVDAERIAVSAPLADGRLAVTTWALEEHYQWVYDKNWRSQLGLLLCDATACAPAPGGKKLAEVTWADRNREVALAARPGGGLVVAQLHGLAKQRDVEGELLSLTICDDPGCAHPRAKDVTNVPVSSDTGGGRDLIAGVGPDDRAIMLRLDQDSGAIQVISCDDPACARARVEQPVADESPDTSPDRPVRPPAAMAIRADGRPLIAYQDMADGTIKLLDCRTRACSQADTVTLTAPRDRVARPALVLDRAGRALVAFKDLDREQIVIATCTGKRCTQTPVTTIPRGGGSGLAMTLDGRGRPTLAWMNVGAGDDWDVIVTTPLTLR
ncbi:hypothetical protein ACWEJ6_53190 [Nonomuraea sp. NPDC004702]